jgi:hypothetical protein
LKKLFGLSILLVASSSWAFTLGSSNFDGGWGGDTLALDYNPDNCPDSLDSAIDKAIEVWNSAPTSGLKLKRGDVIATTPIQLINGSPGSLANPVIVCDTAFSSNVSNIDPDFVGGYGFFKVASGDSEIRYGGLVMNVQAAANGNITNLDTTGLEVLTAHEIGHTLGLGHSEKSYALMYYNIGNKTELRLSQDDIDGITYLYPRNEIAGSGLYGCDSHIRGPIGATKSPSPWSAAWIFLPFLVAGWYRRKLK